MIPIGKMMMAAGALFFLIGLAFTVGARFGLGSLPGDLAVRRGNTSFFFPIVSSIVLSVVLSIVLNLVMRFWK